MKLIKRDISGV